MENINEGVTEFKSASLKKKSNEEINDFIDSLGLLIKHNTSESKKFNLKLKDDEFPRVPAIVNNWCKGQWISDRKSATLKDDVLAFLTKSIFRHDFLFKGVDYENTKKHGILFIFVESVAEAGIFLTMSDTKYNRHNNRSYTTENTNGSFELKENEVFSMGIGYVEPDYTTKELVARKLWYLDNISDPDSTKNDNTIIKLLLANLEKSKLTREAKLKEKEEIITLHYFRFGGVRFYNFKTAHELWTKSMKLVLGYDLNYHKNNVEQEKYYDFDLWYKTSYSVSDASSSGNDFMIKAYADFNFKEFKQILKEHFDIDFEKASKDLEGAGGLHDSGLF